MYRLNYDFVSFSLIALCLLIILIRVKKGSCEIQGSDVSETMYCVVLLHLLLKTIFEFCDAFSKSLTFSQLVAGEKARSPWLQMRAIGRLGKVRLLAPLVLHTSSDKKHLTFSVWEAEVTLCVCFSGHVRGQGKTQVQRGSVCVSSCMCVSLADLK